MRCKYRLLQSITKLGSGLRRQRWSRYSRVLLPLLIPIGIVYVFLDQRVPLTLANV